MGETERATLFPTGVVAPAPRRRCARRANDLEGKAWQRNSISIWSDIEKSPAERRLAHPAMFPSALVERLIECFTRADERVVLDPFLGSGSTIVAARRLGRVGVGFEVYPEFAQLAERRVRDEAMLPGMGRGQAGAETTADGVKIIRADARRITEFLEPDSVDFCVTSPPYWDILSQKRTADGKDIRDYGASHADLSRIADYWAFIDALCDVFAGVLTVLRPGKYCVVNVMDLRKKDVFYPFHSDLARHMVGIGFSYDDLIIWDRRREYNNMRPLGYPSVFRINRAHEFLLIFQKPARPRKLP
ncbi:MAG: site-specific DNA-methyltransferase [Planctomycetes bacterium]|nr:site-specific DNA-methyltransferase [Planctomycetota bacterium]